VATAIVIDNSAAMGNAAKSLSVEKEPYSGNIRWQKAGHSVTPSACKELTNA
jgi:hypothetical protein